MVGTSLSWSPMRNSRAALVAKHQRWLVRHQPEGGKYGSRIVTHRLGNARFGFLEGGRRREGASAGAEAIGQMAKRQPQEPCSHASRGLKKTRRDLPLCEGERRQSYQTSPRSTASSDPRHQERSSGFLELAPAPKPNASLPKPYHAVSAIKQGGTPSNRAFKIERCPAAESTPAGKQGRDSG